MSATPVTRLYSAVVPLVCGVLVACAAPAGPALLPPRQRHAESPTPPAELDSANYAPLSRSPQPLLGPSADPAQEALSGACGETDAALQSVAAELAEQEPQGALTIDADAITEALRAHGAPYVWPRAWLFSGSESEVELGKARMQRWLASFSEGGARRCGVAVVHRAGSRISVGAVAVDVLADLEPMPTRARIGQWVDLSAALRAPASAAKWVVMGPRGAPHAVPTSFSQGQVRARFNADQPGIWLVQLLAAVEGGPRPLLESVVFAGVEPSRRRATEKAPGEDLPHLPSDARAVLYALIAQARSVERLPPLARDERLERVAQAHAEAMRRARKTAHDAGDGDLIQRLEQLGLELSAGENVAHAESAVLAQRALWASPSHRENLLFPSFRLIGVGVAADDDGTLWVCQVFGAEHSL